MVIQLETWQVVSSLFTLIAFSAGLIKYSLSQLETRFDERRQAIATDIEKLSVRVHAAEAAYQTLEREFFQFRADLPLSYIRREDYIRNQTAIESKLDALASKMEQIYQRGMPHA